MAIELEEVICSEIVERIHRTEVFLHECILEERPENRKLITCFIKEVEITKGFIKEAVINLIDLKRRKPVSEYNRLSILKRFIGASVIIETIVSNNTYFLKGINARPETDVFIRRLIPEMSVKPSIVLLPAYNFFHANVLSPIIKKLYEKGILEVERISRNPIVSLPNIGFMNPLMWGILIHEIAHEIEDSKNIGEMVVKKQGLEGKPEELRLTKNWIIEFFSDLFATRTLGPAFLIPSITFSLLDPNLKDPHFEHPPTYERIGVLYNYLRKVMGVKHKIIDDYMGLLENRYRLMPRITMFELFGIDFKEEEWERIPPSCLLRFDEIIEILEPELNRFPIIFQQEKLESCDFLAKELGRNISICSIPEEKDLLEMIVGINPNKEYVAEELFDYFVERPTDMCEILNVGWASRFKNDYDEFSGIFLDKEISSDDDYFGRFEEFGKYLNFKDSLIMKSIETSDICRIFGGVDENDTE